MITKDKITEIFCTIDDFCLVFEPAFKNTTFYWKKDKKAKIYNVH